MYWHYEDDALYQEASCLDKSIIEMMHVVPDTLKTSVDPNNPLALLAPLSPSYSPPSSPFDFDIDVLTPNLEIPSLLTLPANSGEEDQRKVNLHVNSNQDCCYSPITSLESSRQVPTSPSIFSLESDVLSPTMFSPSGEKEHKYPHSPPGIIKGQTGNRHRFAPQSSPYSLVPGSPVTPVGRPIRRQSSTDSGKTVVSVASSSGSGCLSLQESLNEYAEIQMKVKLEQESKESNKTLLQELGIKSTDSGGSVQNPTIAKQETPMLRKALEDQNNDFMKNASEDPVISLAMEQVQRDIKTTSEILSISTNPNEWSSGDVGRWITWHQHQYNISNPVFNPMASEDGLSLSKMSEYEFSKRFREGGDVMFAQYDIWRTAASDCSQQLLPRQENVVNESIPEQPPKSDLDSAKDFGFNSCALDMLEGQRQVQHHDPGYNPNGFTQGSLTIIPSLSNNSIYQQPPEMLPKPLPSQTLSDTSAMKPDYDPITVTKFEDVKPQIHQPPPSYDESIMSLPNIIKQYPASSSLSISPVSGSSASVTLERIPPPPAYPNQYPDPRTEQQQQINDELDDDEENDDDGKFCETQATCSRSSSNIHLWQFIKELLLQPESHSSCICWVDRERGIFKIVDSVRVATLWGKRKNRPAMNYDKLSRSLRQYYKKGIMKKTERTQRLVYQFCHPYHL